LAYQKQAKNTENYADTAQKDHLSGERKSRSYRNAAPDNEEDFCDGIKRQAGALPWINVHDARHAAGSAESQISFNLIIISRR
jgi:hypothetical protein